MAEKKLCVALLAGGKSGEREVSLKGAEEVGRALDSQQYSVRSYDPATDMARLAAEAGEIDVAFVLLHGKYGEDGTVQGFLDLLGIPYQGAGVLGSAVAMDKDIAKILYRNAGLRVPDWVMAIPDDATRPDRILEILELPLVIKPVRQGSSLGMSIAHTPDELAKGVGLAFSHDTEVMVEQYVAGREITGGVLGNDNLTALPLVEIIPGDSYTFFDYEAKYKPGATKEICPADLDTNLASRAQQAAIKAHKALKLRGYSRTDMIVCGDDIFILETNTIPGMTPTSLLPQAAEAYGFSFSSLLDRLIALAMEK